MSTFVVGICWPVVIFHTETTGAFNPALDGALRALDVQSRIRGADDYTQYGLARSSPRTFYAHHAAVISMTIVLLPPSVDPPNFLNKNSDRSDDLRLRS